MQGPTSARGRGRHDCSSHQLDDGLAAGTPLLSSKAETHTGAPVRIEGPMSHETQQSLETDGHRTVLWRDAEIVWLQARSGRTVTSAWMVLAVAGMNVHESWFTFRGAARCVTVVGRVGPGESCLKMIRPQCAPAGGVAVPGDRGRGGAVGRREG
ncbi:hypothetical protein GCM10009646_87940 [Streptomyces aureus]